MSRILDEMDVAAFIFEHETQMYQAGALTIAPIHKVPGKPKHGFVLAIGFRDTSHAESFPKEARKIKGLVIALRYMPSITLIDNSHMPNLDFITSGGGIRTRVTTEGQVGTFIKTHGQILRRLGALNFFTDNVSPHTRNGGCCLTIQIKDCHIAEDFRASASEIYGFTTLLRNIGTMFFANGEIPSLALK